MGLSLAEQETTINWSRADDWKATVYTADPVVIRKLRKNAEARVIATHTDEQGHLTGQEFEIPVALLTIRSGRQKGRPLSPQHLEALMAGRDKRLQKAA